MNSRNLKIVQYFFIGLFFLSFSFIIFYHLIYENRFVDRQFLTEKNTNSSEKLRFFSEKDFIESEDKWNFSFSYMENFLKLWKIEFGNYYLDMQWSFVGSDRDKKKIFYLKESDFQKSEYLFQNKFRKIIKWIFSQPLNQELEKEYPLFLAFREKLEEERLKWMKEIRVEKIHYTKYKSIETKLLDRLVIKKQENKVKIHLPYIREIKDPFAMLSSDSLYIMNKKMWNPVLDYFRIRFIPKLYFTNQSEEDLLYFITAKKKNLYLEYKIWENLFKNIQFDIQNKINYSRLLKEYGDKKKFKRQILEKYKSHLLSYSSIEMHKMNSIKTIKQSKNTPYIFIKVGNKMLENSFLNEVEKSKKVELSYNPLQKNYLLEIYPIKKEYKVFLKKEKKAIDLLQYAFFLGIEKFSFKWNKIVNKSIYQKGDEMYFIQKNFKIHSLQEISHEKGILKIAFTTEEETLKPYKSIGSF